MKKTLLLAMTIAMGITASAYAANPFSDVPAGHWAYDAVNKLAAEGVVEGYPDGTYGGDRLMTRYEMAQIVAKQWRRVQMLTNWRKNLPMSWTALACVLLIWKRKLIT